MSPLSRAGNASLPTHGELMIFATSEDANARLERARPDGKLRGETSFQSAFRPLSTSTSTLTSPSPSNKKNTSDAIEACKNLPPADEAACMLALGCDAEAVHNRLDAEEEEEAKKKKAEAAAEAK